MRRALAGVVLAAAASGLEPAAANVTRDQFLANTLQDLVALCTATEDDPLHQGAFGFCEGYLVGAWHFHEELARGKKGKRIACAPDPRPTRVEVIQQFMAWSKEHPQYLGASPVDAFFRFAAERYPCPASRKGGRQ